MNYPMCDSTIHLGKLIQKQRFACAFYLLGAQEFLQSLLRSYFDWPVCVKKIHVSLACQEYNMPAITCMLLKVLLLVKD